MHIDPESWPTLSLLLDQWLDLPPEARSAWLDCLGPEYASVAPLLRELVNNPEIHANFLEQLPELPTQPELAFAGDAIVGPYRLIRELGRGGTGTVWLAERADGTLKRYVALKLPLVPVLDRAVNERFERERDILAQLSHPNIARLYDAGITEAGQAYLALEYVEGEAITACCDRAGLGTNARLTLFRDVLRAVQYAHTNLIVHRDLKPANILVNRDGEVRLLDFGIARLLSDGQAGESELTRSGGRLLTPGYASPEQLAGQPVTTATDIYSLGVVLYELLSGARPRSVSETSRPSAAITEAAARARGSGLKRLRAALRGDIDNIVLRALRSRPGDRYLTADSFAQDIERYLNNEPVLARPESAWYRTRKFVSRHKLPVASVAAVVLALGAGFGVALHQARLARMHQKTAESVQAFLQNLFRANSSAQPDPIKARQTTARELLDIGARNIDDALKDAPEAKLGVLVTLADLYNDLGLKDHAVAIERKRVQLARTVFGPSSPQTAAALAEFASNIGESSFADERGALLQEAERILDRNHDSTSRTRAVLYQAISKHYLSIDPARSADAAARAVEIYRRYPPSLELVQALRDEGTIYRDRNNYPRAIDRLSEAAALARRMGDIANPSLPSLYAYLADAQYVLMDFSAAEQSYRQALASARVLRGEEHEDIIQTRYRLGNFLVLTSRPQEGLKMLAEALALALRIKGPREVFHLGSVEANYGRMLIRYGDPESGLTHIERALDLRQGLRSTRNYAQTLDWKAGGDIELGRYRQAAAALDEAEVIYAKSGDKPSSALVRFHRSTRAALLAAEGRVEEASRQLGNPPDGKDLTFGWLDDALAFADLELAAGRFDEARNRAAGVRARIASSRIASYLAWYDARAALTQGVALLRTGHAGEALPLLTAAAGDRHLYDPARSLQLAAAKIALAECLRVLGQREASAAALVQAKAIHAAHREIGDPFRHSLDRLLRLRKKDALLPPV